MRVLLDTNVLLRAAGKSSGPARAVFLRLLDPPYALIASSYLLDELRRVLNYPRVQRLHGLTPQESEQFVRDVEAVAEVVDVPALLPFQIPNDPDDEPIVAAAVYGRVGVLVTRDRHLRHPEVATYCAQFNIRILTDTELLAEFNAQASS